MTNYQYLIIGGGMTAAAAADGIREVDSTGSMGIVSAEPDAPYNRPPLSKALWKGTPLDTIWRKTEDKRVEMHLGCTIKELVPEQKRVVDEKGNAFTYEKLCWPPVADPGVFCSMTRSFTIGRSRITDGFAHSLSRESGLR